MQPNSSKKRSNPKFFKFALAKGYLSFREKLCGVMGFKRIADLAAPILQHSFNDICRSSIDPDEIGKLKNYD
jgi:hypothetical protein